MMKTFALVMFVFLTACRVWAEPPSIYSSFEEQYKYYVNEDGTINEDRANYKLTIPNEPPQTQEKQEREKPQKPFPKQSQIKEQFPLPVAELARKRRELLDAGLNLPFEQQYEYYSDLYKNHPELFSCRWIDGRLVCPLPGQTK